MPQTLTFKSLSKCIAIHHMDGLMIGVGSTNIWMNEMLNKLVYAMHRICKNFYYCSKHSCSIILIPKA